MAEYGQWPWPRSLLAEIVNRALDARAAVVAIDMIMSEPDRSRPRQFANSTEGIDERTRTALSKLPDTDLVLAEAMTRGPVVLGIYNPGDSVRSEFVPPARPQVQLSDRETIHLPQAASIVGPVSSLAKAAAAHGMLNIGTDFDGVTRLVPTLFLRRELVLPSFAIEVLRAARKSGFIMASVKENGFE